MEALKLNKPNNPMRICEPVNTCLKHYIMVCSFNPEDLNKDPKKILRTDTFHGVTLNNSPYYINSKGTAVEYPDTVDEKDIPKKYELHSPLIGMHPNNFILSEDGLLLSGQYTLPIYKTISGKLFYYNKNNVALYYLGHIPLEDLPKCSCNKYNF